MNIVQGITAYPNQTMSLVLADGSSFQLTMYYSPLQIGWFITNLTYNDFVLNGLRIVVNVNMLNQFINQLPFGLGCLTTLNREPTQIQDFASGAFNLYVLSSAECEQYVQYLQAGPP